MFTSQEIESVHQAFNAAIKATPDSMAAAKILMPIFGKILVAAKEIDKTEDKKETQQ